MTEETPLLLERIMRRFPSLLPSAPSPHSLLSTPCCHSFPHSSLPPLPSLLSYPPSPLSPSILVLQKMVLFRLCNARCSLCLCIATLEWGKGKFPLRFWCLNCNLSAYIYIYLFWVNDNGFSCYGLSVSWWNFIFFLEINTLFFFLLLIMSRILALTTTEKCPYNFLYL